MDYLTSLDTTSKGLVWIGSSEWGSLRSVLLPRCFPLSNTS